MKSIGAIVLLLVVATALAAPRPEDAYTSKYDNIDIDEILNSDRLLKNYVSCMLDKGKCTPAGKELKDHIPDVLENGCKKCTEKQKDLGKKVMKFLLENKREYYDQLEKKYDPNGSFKKRYHEELEKQGIKV